MTGPVGRVAVGGLLRPGMTHKTVPGKDLQEEAWQRMNLIKLWKHFIFQA